MSTEKDMIACMDCREKVCMFLPEGVHLMKEDMDLQRVVF